MKSLFLMLALLTTSSAVFADGGINVDQYCKQRFGGNASAYLVSGDAYSWYCGN